MQENGEENMDIFVIIIIAAISVVSNINKKKKAEAARQRQAAQRQVVQAAMQGDPRFPREAPAQANNVPDQWGNSPYYSEGSGSGEGASYGSPYGTSAHEAPAPRHVSWGSLPFPEADSSEGAPTSWGSLPQSAPAPVDPAREAAEAAQRRAEWDRKRLLELRRKEQARMAQSTEGPPTRDPNEKRDTLSTLQTTISASHEKRHTLEATSLVLDGHTHIESSLSGTTPDCPPPISRAAVKKPAPAQPPLLQGIVWDRNTITQGILLGEILGKPKALQRTAK